MELTKDNLIDEINKKFQQIDELWDISDKECEVLPTNEKQLFYKKEKEIQTEISNMIILTLSNTKSFTISEFGNLESEEFDITLNIRDENIEIERGCFKTQEYLYRIIEFNKKDFQKYLFDFFEKDMKWYKRNDGIFNKK